MRFKAGLLIGFGAGYVLGARAGRERYEQLREQWDRLTGSPAVHRVAERTKEVATDQGQRGLHAVQQGVEKAGAAVKDKLAKDSETGAGKEAISESWPGAPDQLPPADPKAGEVGT